MYVVTLHYRYEGSYTIFHSEDKDRAEAVAEAVREESYEGDVTVEKIVPDVVVMPYVGEDFSFPGVEVKDTRKKYRPPS